MTIKLTKTVTESPTGAGSVVACSDRVDRELSEIEERIAEFNFDNESICELVHISDYQSPSGGDISLVIEPRCCTNPDIDSDACIDTMVQDIQDQILVCSYKEDVVNACQTIEDFWADFRENLLDAVESFENCDFVGEERRKECDLAIGRWQSFNHDTRASFLDRFDADIGTCNEIGHDLENLISETDQIINEVLNCSQYSSPNGVLGPSPTSTLTPEEPV